MYPDTRLEFILTQTKNIVFPDQEEADLKADDAGEVREGQETARAKEVWQEGWCLFSVGAITFWI